MPSTIPSRANALALGKPTPAMQQQAALQALEQQRADNLKTMFANASISLRIADRIKAARDIAGAAYDIHENVDKIVKRENLTLAAEAKKGATAAGKLGSAIPADASKVKQMLCALGGVDSIDELGKLLPELQVPQLVGDIIPVVAQIKTGYELVKATYDCAREIHLHHKSKQIIQTSILPGDPAAAAEALRGMIKQEAASQAGDAALAATKLSVSIASIPVDAGIGTNVALTLASFAKKLLLLGLEIDEMKKGNAALKTGPIDIKLFDVSPLLGCYLLVNSNTSDVVNLLTRNIGKAGWMSDVEKMKKQIDPLLDRARGFIRESSLEVKGLPMNMAGKGLSTMQKAKNFFSGKMFNGRKF